MEFKFNNSSVMLFEYLDDLVDGYLHQKQRDQAEDYLIRTRYEEEKELLCDKIRKYPEYVQQLWLGAYLGKEFKEKDFMFRIGVSQCPFLLYLFRLASYDFFEQDGAEKSNLYRGTEIGIYHFTTKEKWYNFMKQNVDLNGFFAGTGFQYQWIGAERTREACGLAIFPAKEELLQYSFREMDRLQDGTICFKEEFMPEFVRKSKETRRHWVTISVCRLTIAEELLIKHFRPRTEKEMKNIIAMAMFAENIALKSENVYSRLEELREKNILTIEDLYENLIFKGVPLVKAGIWCEGIRMPMSDKKSYKVREKELADVFGESAADTLLMTAGLPSKWLVAERFQQLSDLKLLPCMI